MDDSIRVSDADRDHVTAQLRDHFAAGRITPDELDERLSSALNAKTFGDLRRIMADLPGLVPAALGEAPPRLGIAIAPRRVARRLRRAVGLPDTEGLLIQQVTEDSPAARAGLSSGDLIVAAAGQPVGGVDDLFDALQGAQGGTLELRVVRGADERTVQVVFTPETEGK